MLGLTESNEVEATGMVATDTIWEPDAFIIGSGTKFSSEVKPNDMISINDTKAKVARVDSDAKLTLWSNWTGDKTAGATMTILKPLTPEQVIAKKKAEGVLSAGARPFYKSPIFIVIVIAAGLGLTYYLIRRGRNKR